MRELKKNLRKKIIAQRSAMDASKKAEADIDIFEQLKPLVEKASSVFVYASTDIEVDTRRLINFCLDKSIPVALPVSGDRELTFYYIKSMEDLSIGRYGIYEPVTTDLAIPDEKTLCIVPALCADGNGYRLGYGKGYYDRFLNNFNGKSVIICYSNFKCDVPTELHDVRADVSIFDRNRLG